jgi:hypothetical protein
MATLAGFLVSERTAPVSFLIVDAVSATEAASAGMPSTWTVGSSCWLASPFEGGSWGGSSIVMIAMFRKVHG